MNLTRARLRGLALVTLLLCAGVVGHAAATAPSGVVGASESTSADATGGVERTTVPPRDHVTVVATDSNTWLGLESDGPRANAELVAFAPNGSVLYYEDAHTRYWDVDPVENRSRTVEYLYADHLNASECGGDSACTRNGIERVNLSTGEVSTVYEATTPGKHSTRWHDGDRLNETRYVVADIAEDRVFVVNTTTGIIEWAWNAQSAFDVRDTGGPYPSDWTHLNDVEVVDDGRLMVSLRNHDRVVFVDRETGLVEGRTLGDGDHDVVYEQHNPDYLPGGDGPPSVLVADSENNRIVEYRATAATGPTDWERTWTWQDDETQWPRDADRLPNGHTLITDSNGNRVVEVDESGEVVWRVDIAFPYEAERLGTGDESTGGPPAATAGLDSRTAAGGGEAEADADTGLLSGPTVNAVMYVLPVWMGLPSLGAAVAGLTLVVVWVGAELYWSPYRVRGRTPVVLDRED